MKQRHIQVGVEDAARGFERFVDAWKRAESGELRDTEVHLNFEDYAQLSAILTPKRVELLQSLRQGDPVSVRALATRLGRDYKNVHVDVAALEDAGLLTRDNNRLLIAPWDVIEARVRLVA